MSSRGGQASRESQGDGCRADYERVLPERVLQAPDLLLFHVYHPLGSMLRVIRDSLDLFLNVLAGSTSALFYALDRTLIAARTGRFVRAVSSNVRGRVAGAPLPAELRVPAAGLPAVLLPSVHVQPPDTDGCHRSWNRVLPHCVHDSAPGLSHPVSCVSGHVLDPPDGRFSDVVLDLILDVFRIQSCAQLVEVAADARSRFLDLNANRRRFQLLF